MITKWDDFGIEKKAARARLRDVMQHYGHFPENKQQILCPLPSHHEKTASFVLYEETNSFHCYGCKKNGGPIQFVMEMEECSDEEAVKKILSLNVGKTEKVKEREYVLDLLLDFSNYIRPRIQAFGFTREIEEFMKAMDYVMENNAMTRKNLQEFIRRFKSMFI